ncbi:15272_t:CDS:2 [Gigaspora margarita]|uniref:15272_t:CDS:1 n=1 Tax=Gigaspora margarita TaxID=4874 RepID=A0ABN7UNA7_GIGMA|nr:15272_t:CDS:2 [Gigaspora margarita]
MILQVIKRKQITGLEMTLNESKIEVLTGDNLEEAEKKVVLLYAECGLEETLITKTKIIVKNKDKIEINSRYNNIKLDLQTSLTLWDFLANSRLAKIKWCFSYFGKITVSEWKDFDKTRAVFVNIQCRNKKKKEIYKVHGPKHRAVLREIPYTVLKAALLRQLERMKAKIVFIPKNSNENQKSIALFILNAERI